MEWAKTLPRESSHSINILPHYRQDWRWGTSDTSHRGWHDWTIQNAVTKKEASIWPESLPRLCEEVVPEVSRWFSIYFEIYWYHLGTLVNSGMLVLLWWKCLWTCLLTCTDGAMAVFHEHKKATTTINVPSAMDIIGPRVFHPSSKFPYCFRSHDRKLVNLLIDCFMHG